MSEMRNFWYFFIEVKSVTNFTKDPELPGMQGNEQRMQERSENSREGENGWGTDGA